MPQDTAGMPWWGLINSRTPLANLHYRLASTSLRANRAFPSRPARLSGRRNRVSFFRMIMETFLRLGIPVLRRSTLARSCAFSTRFSLRLFLILSTTSRRRFTSMLRDRRAVEIIARAKKKPDDIYMIGCIAKLLRIFLLADSSFNENFNWKYEDF